jgi:hypothetical protein
MGGLPSTSGITDLTTMPLEEQATVLFNRVMMSNSAGNTDDVAFFLPKALVIHEQLDPLDPDGLYHYALLLMVGDDPEGALAKAFRGWRRCRITSCCWPLRARRRQLSETPRLPRISMPIFWRFTTWRWS